MKHLFVIVIMLFSFLAFAEGEIQSDWAGGPGTLGPVTDWQDKFYMSGDMDWDTEPGQLKLIVNKDENHIASVDGPTYVVAADMDNDGDLDIACCGYNSGEVFWSENTNGLGTAWTKHLVGSVSTPRFIAVADFDVNGYRDIAVSLDSENKIVLISCFAAGWSLPTDIATGFDARQIRAVDFNNDKLMDLVGVSSASGDVCWWHNNGSSTNWSINYIDGALLGAYTCDTGDFNNDGHPDVVAASNSNGTVNTYFSQAPHGYSWAESTVNSSFNNAIDIAVGDYNGDGCDDFAIVSSSGGGDLHWYDYLDTSSTWISHAMDGAAAQNIYSIDAHDMDGDGYPEIIAASLGESKIFWCKNREYLGMDWETHVVSDEFAGARGVSVGDISGDGIPDVLGCAYYGDEVSWWRVSGFTTPSSVTSSIVDIEPEFGPGSVVWEYLHWSATTPTGTSIRIRLKTSYNSSSMGAWSAWLTSPADIGSVVAQGGQYLQYQAELSTTNLNVTPSLKDVSVLWTPVGIEEEGSAPVDGRKIWLTSGTPVTGAFSIGYNVEQTGNVDIAVYDVTGRTVHVVNSGRLNSGQYSEMVSGLPAGSYAVVMQSSESTSALRVVVLR